MKRTFQRERKGVGWDNRSESGGLDQRKDKTERIGKRIRKSLTTKESGNWVRVEEDRGNSEEKGRKTFVCPNDFLKERKD